MKYLRTKNGAVVVSSDGSPAEIVAGDSVWLKFKQHGAESSDEINLFAYTNYKDEQDHLEFKVDSVDGNFITLISSTFRIVLALDALEEMEGYGFMSGIDAVERGKYDDEKTFYIDCKIIQYVFPITSDEL